MYRRVRNREVSRVRAKNAKVRKQMIDGIFLRDDAMSAANNIAFCAKKRQVLRLSFFGV